MARSHHTFVADESPSDRERCRVNPVESTTFRDRSFGPCNNHTDRRNRQLSSERHARLLGLTVATDPEQVSGPEPVVPRDEVDPSSTSLEQRRIDVRIDASTSAAERQATRLGTAVSRLEKPQSIPLTRPERITSIERGPTSGHGRPEQSVVHDNDRIGPLIAAVRHRRGDPIEPPLKDELERRFGTDFSDVRIHTSGRAQRATRLLDANAFTVGSDVVFGPGQYAPDTDRGKCLLAHELVHVCQQRRDTDESIVQRSVGFEFECDWEVRDVSDETDESIATTMDRAKRKRDWYFLAGVENYLETDEHPEWLSKLPVDPNSYQELLVDIEMIFSEHDHEQASVWTTENDIPVLTEAGQSVLREIVSRVLQDFPPTAAQHAIFTSSMAVSDFLRLVYWDTQFDRLEELVKLFGQDAQTAYSALEPQYLTPKPGTSISRQETILSGESWKLIADDSWGFSALEWVTDPIDSRSTLKETLDEVTETMKWIADRGNRDYLRTNTLVAECNVPNISVHRDALVIPGAKLDFTPQLSAGIRLDRLPTLIESQSLGHWVLPNSYRQSLSWARQSASEVGYGSNPSFIGFLSLLRNYLSGTATVGNAKALAGSTMSRTDFVHAFSILPEEIRTAIRSNRSAFFTLFSKHGFSLDTGMFETENVTMNEINSDMGLLYRDADNYPTITNREWISGIIDGIDILKDPSAMTPAETRYRNRRADSNRWKNIESMGHLGVREPELQKQLIVLEFRQERDNIQWDRVSAIGVAAFDEIRATYDPTLLD